MNARVSLEIRRFIPASPERVFAAWTDPIELAQWWGPANVRCVSAKIDLRVGGQYRICNELPDKTVIWIEGVFEQIQRPNLLVYTWRAGAQASTTEIVTVRMRSQDRGTEIILTHESIETPALRDQHSHGWQGCLDGLAEYLAD